MNNYIEGTEQYKQDRAKKQMLWFGIISLCMTFAGLTSAYIVSMERRDWLEDYDFPQALICLLYTSPSPRDATLSRMPSSA